MNKKRTNRLVTILNVIAILAFYIWSFSEYYLESITILVENVEKSVYNSFIIETLLNNIKIILPLMLSGIGVINIICAIQNRENKKICFWQLAFGIYYLYMGVSPGLSYIGISKVFVRNINTIIFSIVPIILAVINIIRIRKNRPKVIQVISYVGVIILSILSLVELIGTYWEIIAVVMQLIYIHLQDKNVEESKTRKIANVILYYILQAILSVGILSMIIASLVITKINDEIWKSSLSNLYNDISALNGTTIKELYIPVEKNYKFGFIAESGKEKIPCEYDRVSYFNEIEIKGSTYYVALAKKNDKFYIISKTNNNIEIGEALSKYLTNMNDYLELEVLNAYGERAYFTSFSTSFEILLMRFAKEKRMTTQLAECYNHKNIELAERNSKYTYRTTNYSMLIEPICDELDEEDDNYYDEYYYNDSENFSSDETKYKVTVTKSDGEVQSSIVYLPEISEEYSTLTTFTNGYIEFKNEDKTRVGWYDNDGNQTSIPNNYTIVDIRDNKIILIVNDENKYDDDYVNYKMDFVVLDMSGKKLLQTTALCIYENICLIKNENKKMVLTNKNLEPISNEYDKIITGMEIEFEGYSSYY